MITPKEKLEKLTPEDVALSKERLKSRIEQYINAMDENSQYCFTLNQDPIRVDQPFHEYNQYKAGPTKELDLHLYIRVPTENFIKERSEE